ncbi:hypothetical protein ACOJBY_14990 [Enterococcus entomosocium]|uniref:hypothetical protein n=1 Tax=Enterococcus entomosocium TaxID=3034352 RepID=UPI003B59FEAA
MKKFISLTLSALALSSFLMLNVTNANAAEQNYDNNLNVVRGPLTGPDGENLYPGGGPSHFMTNIINDRFSSWGSSIFSPWSGNPTMLNNTLTLPMNSQVTSTPINFTGNTRYKVTIGNLNGTVNVAIWDYANGLVLSERTLTGNGNDVSFDYSHINHWPATGSSIIGLYGESNASTATNFRVDRY